MSEEFHGCDDPRTTPLNVGDKVWYLRGMRDGVDHALPAVVTRIERFGKGHDEVENPPGCFTSGRAYTPEEWAFPWHIHFEIEWEGMSTENRHRPLHRGNLYPRTDDTKPGLNSRCEGHG